VHLVGHADVSKESIHALLARVLGGGGGGGLLGGGLLLPLEKGDLRYP